MLLAFRKSDGQTVTAYFESKKNGPFYCLVCGDEVILKSGRRTVAHFAHADPLASRHADSESDQHRRCKMEIFEALRKMSDVSDLVLEWPMGTVRPDVFAKIRGVPVAIEVQISSLSIETIMARTIDYHQRGIYVLWLLQWTPKLDGGRYTPKLWERWVHAAYYGRVYYWLKGLEVVSYRFEPSLKAVPRATWYDKNGKRMTVGGYSRRSNSCCDTIWRRKYQKKGIPKIRIYIHSCGDGTAGNDNSLFYYSEFNLYRRTLLRFIDEN